MIIYFWPQGIPSFYGHVPYSVYCEFIIKMASIVVWFLIIYTHIVIFQPIDYEAFHIFVDTYLEVETPEELCKHLFLSFIKRPAMIVPPKPPPLQLHGTSSGGLNSGKDQQQRSIKDIAALSAQTICAPVTEVAVATSTTHEDLAGSGSGSGSSAKQILADKLHGLSEKIHQLGHMRSDSGGSFGLDGKRSRAG